MTTKKTAAGDDRGASFSLRDLDMSRLVWKSFMAEVTASNGIFHGFCALN